jgi:hypothetical protein
LVLLDVETYPGIVGTRGSGENNQAPQHPADFHRSV